VTCTTPALRSEFQSGSGNLLQGRVRRDESANAILPSLGLAELAPPDDGSRGSVKMRPPRPVPSKRPVPVARECASCDGVRLLLLNNSARPFNGGANRVVVETCGFLQERGHEVLLAYCDEGPVAVSCAVESMPRGGKPGDFAALCRRWKQDVVQVHSVLGEGLLDEAATVPSTVFLHDQTWFCSTGDRMRRDLTPCHRPHGVSCLFWNYAQGCGRKSPLGNLLGWRRTERLQSLRKLSRMRLQVASRFMREGLLENGHDAGRIDLVPLYAPHPGPVKEAVEPGLLFLPSRLVPPKGVQVALEAVARLRESSWRLVIAGDGWHRSALEEKSRSLGVSDRVLFLGEVSPDEIGRWYQRCEVVLFPVLRHEPFGLVGVEALSHGRPIVAFGGGGAEEWLCDGESAVRVETRTPEAFAAGLAGLLRDPARRLAMADGARRRYQPFEPDAYIARLITSFERAIEEFGIRTRPTS